MSTPFQNRAEAYAWPVIVLSAVVLVLLAALVGAGVTQYRSRAVQRQTARLFVVSGTVLARARGGTAWTSAPSESVIKSGASIRTDENSRAFLTLFEGTTVLLWPESELELASLVSSRYRLRRDKVTLVVRKGTVRIGVGPVLADEREVQVKVGEATIALGEGSFSVFVDGGRARLRVHEVGIAEVVSGRQSAQVTAGEKAEVSADPPILVVQPAKEELLVNGDFSQGLVGWQVVNVRCPDGRPGRGAVVGEGPGAALRLTRTDSQSTYCATEAVQELGRDVSAFGSLRLEASLRLLRQTLPGGGPLGTVYPLGMRVDYRTAEGEGSYAVGFYYWSDGANRTDGAVKVPQGQDYFYRSPVDLMDLAPQPIEVVSVTVSAAGWDYDGLVHQVSLVGE